MLDVLLRWLMNVSAGMAVGFLISGTLLRSQFLIEKAVGCSVVSVVVLGYLFLLRRR